MATLPLETDYINPDVILTTRATLELKDKVIYIRSGALVLLTFLVFVFGISTAFWWIVLTGAAWVGALWYFKRRPTIVLDGRTKKIQLSGITKFAKSQSLPANLVEKVTVMADVTGRARGQYIPQLVLKNIKGGGKKLIVNCFPVEDIIQAHYTAQILATFCRADAFDFRGSQLPILSTHIPARFRVSRADSPKPLIPSEQTTKVPSKNVDVEG